MRMGEKKKNEKEHKGGKGKKRMNVKVEKKGGKRNTRTEKNNKSSGEDIRLLERVG